MSKRQTRVHRESLDANLAQALLNVPCESITTDVILTRSVWERLEAARSEMQEAVKAANAALEGNSLAEILAETVTRQMIRRGNPRIVVDADGTVTLEVHYGEKLPPVMSGQSKRKSGLPPIGSLRKIATDLGIDPAPFGKAKTKLIEAIEKARGNADSPQPQPQPQPEAKVVKTDPVPPEPPKKPKQKRVKTAPSVTSPRRVKLDDRKLVPLDDDDEDIDALFWGESKKPEPEVQKAPAPSSEVKRSRRPPRRGTAATGSTKKKGRKLGDIIANADKTVDIDAILAQPAPKIPPEDE